MAKILFVARLVDFIRIRSQTGIEQRSFSPLEGEMAHTLHEVEFGHAVGISAEVA